jgi:ribosomal protein S18 acetylase RimI-like enzyme
MTPEDGQRFPPVPVILKNGKPAVIRPLEAGDAESLAAFYAAIPRKDIRFYNPHPLTRDMALKNAAAALSPCEVVLVLAVEGGIGGYAWYRWNINAPSSGFGICIHMDFQDSGAGRKLMTRLLEIARTVGPPVMHLTVQKANARAFALYSSMGFKVVREQMVGARAEFAAEPEYYMEWKAP